MPPNADFDWRKLAEAKIAYEKLQFDSKKYLQEKIAMAGGMDPPPCPGNAKDLCEGLTTWYWEHFNPWAQWVTSELGGGPGGTPPPPPPPFK